VGTIRSNLVLEPTGRPGKSTGAIVGKLNRQKTRLSQMQDIAGCRILVPEILAQDRAVDDLLHLFQKAQVFDRRDRPSYGYRAVHVVVTLRSRSVEIQVRTRLQHVWAELSEKLADQLGNEVKYGGGPALIKQLLDQSSQLVAGAETTMAENGKFHKDLHDVLLSLGQAARQLAEMAKQNE
jgi:ppGpp synthetase/RelA/SpoT-type nucleotidyltranferase